MTARFPKITRNASIQLNERRSLRWIDLTISLAEDARAALEFCFCTRVGCRRRGLALVPVGLCRTHFQLWM